MCVSDHALTRAVLAVKLLRVWGVRGVAAGAVVAEIQHAAEIESRGPPLA